MGSTKKFQYQKYEIQLANMYKALGHPARIRIIENLLGNQNVSCKELQYALQLSSASVSRHLQVLFDNNILGNYVVNNMTFYVVNPMSLKLVKSYLKSLAAVAKKDDWNYSNVYFKPPETIQY